MTKQNFYDFAMMMSVDSKLLHNNNKLHNSVYLGVFVLEAYVKILLIDNGATTPRGIRDNSYGGHINDNKMIERLETLHPNVFSNSILMSNHDKYPNNILSDKYDINFRYEVDKWIDAIFCQDIQDEVNNVKIALNELRIQGVLQ